MTERRFSDDEVTEVFRRAAEASQAAASALPSTEGLTLAQLQDIGKEVGLAPEVIADAARSIERREPRFQRTVLGLTIGVGRTVSLDRKVTDEEWERLVVVLRETFDARGRFRVDGSLREWTNGNLQILIEPTEHGDRLRMRTVNAAARGMLRVSALFATIAAAIGLARLVLPPDAVAPLAGALFPMAVGSVVSFGLGMRRVYGWAATRLKQMDEIAARVTGDASP